MVKIAKLAFADGTSRSKKSKLDQLDKVLLQLHQLHILRQLRIVLFQPQLVCVTMQCLISRSSAWCVACSLNAAKVTNLWILLLGIWTKILLPFSVLEVNMEFPVWQSYSSVRRPTRVWQNSKQGALACFSVSKNDRVLVSKISAHGLSSESTGIAHKLHNASRTFPSQWLSKRHATASCNNAKKRLIFNRNSQNWTMHKTWLSKIHAWLCISVHCCILIQNYVGISMQSKYAIAGKITLTLNKLPWTNSLYIQVFFKITCNYHFMERPNKGLNSDDTDCIPSVSLRFLCTQKKQK